LRGPSSLAHRIVPILGQSKRAGRKGLFLTSSLILIIASASTLSRNGEDAPTLHRVRRPHGFDLVDCTLMLTIG